MDEATLKGYLADAPPSVVRLEIKPHFDALTDRERRYAHHVSRASFLGTRIILRQVSPEAESIYDLILALFDACKGQWQQLQQKAGISSEELQGFLEYAGQFLGNVGNYKAVGDVKFVPRISEAAFKALASTSPAAVESYAKTQGGIFAPKDSRLMHLGYPEDGHMTTYYPDSPSITKEEISLVGDFLEFKKLEVYNTRLAKTSDGDYRVLVGSAESQPPKDGGDAGPETSWSLSGPLAGKTLTLVYGDHSKELSCIANEMDSAAANAANDTQRSMHAAYAQSFRTGSAEAFKNSQRSWIRDKGPMVECNIGFIESYRDPHGVRAEWEGFAAMVNKERTKAFGRLVDAAEAMVPKLPWPQEFEKDHFLSPDFTSLEVLSFAGSMIPAGINIPNLDDVRQTEGFKNVSLGNVLSAKSPDEKVPFLSDADVPLFTQYRDAAFEVQVGIHELLGHGTGKLLQETSPGVYNFDHADPPINPLTDAPVLTWYLPSQTWGSVFGSLAASYEECRAECVAMALSCDFSILQVFGFGDGTPVSAGAAADVLYVAYLQMARAGLTALEYYDPAAKKWGQAHAQARWSILRCFLDAPDGFVTLSCREGDDLSRLTIRLERGKILSHGRPAVERYLRELHICKSVADVARGGALYREMTKVEGWWATAVRDEVLRRRVPRKVFVQANTVLEQGAGAEGKVALREYEPTLEGMVQSWAERGV